MRLFIDDIRTPVGEDWVIARTNTEAIEKIVNYPGLIREIHIDHDIECIFPERPELKETFMPVVHFLPFFYNEDPNVLPKIVIHTWNSAAAKKMTRLLLESGFVVVRIPFTVPKVIAK